MRGLHLSAPDGAKCLTHDSLAVAPLCGVGLGQQETIGLVDYLNASWGWRLCAVLGRAAGITLLMFAVAMLVPVRAAGDVVVDRRVADTQFQADLEALAVKCDKLGMSAQAELSRTWFVPRDPRRHYLFMPPAAESLVPATGAAELERQWHAKFMELRREQGERLFALARQSVEAGDEATGYRLLHEVLHEDPEHARAREVLQYTRADRGWRRDVRRSGRRRPRGTHPRFGWPASQYSIVNSEHVELTTNLNARAGQQAVEYLERVYAAWQQLFFTYWSVPGRLAERLQGQDRPLGPEPVFSVVLFNDRDEYVRQLKPAEPQIEMSLGYYSQDLKTAFFYAGDESARTAWVHEATHQFFQETGLVAPQVGEHGNFWVVEGVALYMESLAQSAGYATTGGVDAERLQYARYRRLSEAYYVPLEQLVDYGRARLQADPDIRKLYSQAAGLTHFFLQADDGRRLGAFVNYLKAVYRGVAQAATLAGEMNQSFAQLDERYPQYLQVTDDDLAFVRPDVLSLCLGHTSVTDAGLARLPRCTDLQWLDLSFTVAGDDGVACFAEARQLRQLNLEGTRITDDSLQLVGEFSKLEELDLSRTAVTDRGLSQVARLSGLKILWLTGTQVTDEGLMHLAALRRLEQLDVEHSRVTPAALEHLREQLPLLDRKPLP